MKTLPIIIGFNSSTVLLILLLFMLIVILVRILLEREFLNIVLYLGVFSLVMCVCYLLMDAPDVAMTEVAIGVTLFTVVLLRFHENTRENDKDIMLHISKPMGIGTWEAVLSLSIGIVLFAALIFVGHEMVTYGSISVMHEEISKYYIENTVREIGIPSYVAGILASYRGYDTLLETTVIFIAGVGVHQISRSDLLKGDNHNLITRGVESDQIKFIIGSIIPYVILFTLYIQINGEVSPGGGFQAGAILTSILIGFMIVNSNVQVPNTLLAYSGIGILIYCTMGIFPMLYGSNFLNYSALPIAHAQKWGIFYVEIGVGIAVSSTMLFIYTTLAHA